MLPRCSALWNALRTMSKRACAPKSRESYAMEAFPLWFGRLAVTAFFAVAFLQSAVDKVVDRQGNLEYLTGHFTSSPLRSLVQPMLLAITILEAIAGVLCGLGALCLLVGCGTGLALWGLLFSLIALLCLFFGQRLAKAYGGAAVMASYYAVAILGLFLLGMKSRPRPYPRSADGVSV